MPIIYVHGVFTRDDRDWDLIEGLLRQFIAPKIAKDPENVMVSRCYWGDYGAKFRWGGASAPTSPLREGMQKLTNEALLKSVTSSVAMSKPAALKQKVKEKFAQVESEIPHTVAEAKMHMLFSSAENVKRNLHATGHVFARAAVEIKSPMNRFVTMFIGDVLTYLTERGNYKSPGWIPSCFLASLAEARDNQKERGGEPIIVMSHSMGGQIVYDAVTHFMPRMEEFADTKIDFWVATASQVGLFEELKLFLESSDEYTMETGIPAPFPSNKHLGYWWNVWDHNDFISYSVRGIVDGADDESYNTGMFVVGAHNGYLEMPSFFKKFAKKLQQSMTTSK
jgi:hypothetical protein